MYIFCESFAHGATKSFAASASSLLTPNIACDPLIAP